MSPRRRWLLGGFKERRGLQVASWQVSDGCFGKHFQLLFKNLFPVVASVTLQRGKKASSRAPRCNERRKPVGPLGGDLHLYPGLHSQFADLSDERGCSALRAGIHRVVGSDEWIAVSHQGLG